MCEKFPEFLRLKAKLATERNEWDIQRNCESSLEKLAIQEKGFAGILRMFRRYLHRSFPLAKQLKRIWVRKHRIPRKLADVLMRLAAGRSGP